MRAMDVHVHEYMYNIRVCICASITSVVFVPTSPQQQHVPQQPLPQQQMPHQPRLAWLGGADAPEAAASAEATGLEIAHRKGQIIKVQVAGKIGPMVKAHNARSLQTRDTEGIERDKS